MSLNEAGVENFAFFQIVSFFLVVGRYYRTLEQVAQY